MDRVAVVTGASRGIGAEVVRRLVADGVTVYAGTRDGRAVDGAHGVPLDITDQAQVDGLVRRLQEEHGHLDILVNNAAAFVDWSETGSVADLEAAAKVMDTNLFGTWRVISAMLSLLLRSAHPRIVNVSSGAGSHTDPDFGLTRRGGAAASYGISKAALNALTATLAAELVDSPVIINAVCPGLTATWPGAETMGARPVPESVESILWAITLGDDGPRGGFFRDGTPLGW